MFYCSITFFILFFCFVLFLTLALRQADVSMVVPSSCGRLPWDPPLLAASSRLELHVKARKECRAGCFAICFLPLSFGLCICFASLLRRCPDWGPLLWESDIFSPSLLLFLFFTLTFSVINTCPGGLEQHPSTSHFSSQ